MQSELTAQTIILTLGAAQLRLGDALVLTAVLVALIVLALIIALFRGRAARHRLAEEARHTAQAAQAQVAQLAQSQTEIQGRLASMTEIFGARQSELNKHLQERLDAMGNRIGQTMNEQQRSTHENLTRLQERLAVIDTAQNNIQSLAGQVVELQSILSNKQTRGAFGQGRMEAIIADGLPQGSFTFQHTLSNGTRPDCLIHMPNDAPGLVIDAKFPLEGWNGIRAAEDDATRLSASRQFRRDMELHVRAIADKYLIAGETQDTAFLFVPSESIFADIHESHEGIIEKAHKARVVIVSPSLLMLSVQVVQALLKDVRMREQAHLIQGEVVRLMEDVTRLDERVRKLQTHFGQASKDIDDILVSSQKLTRRGQKIEALEFEQPSQSGSKAGAAGLRPDAATPPPAGTGPLRLRVVDPGDDTR